MRFLFLFILTACAQVTSLNLEKHEFGVQPRRIIWFQIAGLEEEHLALLKYDYQSTSTITSFERFSCYGKMWDYNLFELRPGAKANFLSQLTGSPNIKNTCEDYELPSVWAYLADKGYKGGIFETPMSAKNSLVNQCTQREDSDFIKTATLWKMQKSNTQQANYFHFEKKDDYKSGTVYYDKSCVTGECFTKVSKNLIGVFDKFTKKTQRFFYLIKDFSFAEALKSNDIIGAKNILNELDKSLNVFVQYAQNNPGVLVLVTTASSIELEFPTKGPEWRQYLKKGKFIRAKKEKLISNVFAFGARSENFCGIYEQKDLLQRLFSNSKQEGLKLKFVNPFQ